MPTAGPKWKFPRVFRHAGPIVGVLKSLALFVAIVNVLFWVLVAAQFAPVNRSYTEGRILWLGRHVLVFGHGYWDRSDGYWQHKTITKLEDGKSYDGPTLDLIARLHREGARSVWGSWCYSGDFPYIRKDLITGRTTPWPSYASYNRAPGITIPIWLGAAFVRLGWPRSEYDIAPEVIEYRPPDTLLIQRPSLQRFVSTFYSIRGVGAELPNPDSLSWTAPPDRSFSISWKEYRSLPWAEKWELREIPVDSTTTEEPRTTTLQFWIRGRPFPVHIRLPEPR